MMSTRETDLPPHRTPRIAHTRNIGTPPKLKIEQEYKL